jgi:phytanoyl-CoA hydroxylase
MSAIAELPQLGVGAIEVFADDLNVARAAEIYREYGCLVVRGLSKRYVPQLQRDIEAAAQASIAQLDQAVKIKEGWRTPNGSLFLPAPAGFLRDKQLMCLNVGYFNSGTFFQAAVEKREKPAEKPREQFTLMLRGYRR